MAKEAASEPLLYIVDAGGIYAVTYPQGKLVGELTDIETPAAACSDASGNVFVTADWTEDVLEYARGGTKPIAKLGDYGYEPNGCAIDPKTGNLAVANTEAMDGGVGNVAIYTKAQGKPTDYSPPYGASWCAYDNQGDLLVGGNGGGYAEMPAGGSGFENVDLDITGQGIQWDGTYFAIVNPAGKEIYRVSVSGSKGSVVSTVQYTGLFFGLGYDFVFAESKIVIPYAPKQSGELSRIATAKYPQGGSLGKPLNIDVDGPYYALALSK